MKTVFILTILSLAILSVYLWFPFQSEKKAIEDDGPKIIIQEHFQSKMKKYLPYPLTVEDTEGPVIFFVSVSRGP